MELTFGKFKGLSISDPEVTTKYLEWLCERMTQDAAELQAELARREQAEAGNLTMAGRLVMAGFRALAKEFKDDTDAMRDLGGARAALDEVLEHYFEDQAKTEGTRKMNAARDSKDARNRASALQVLNDKDADEDEREWARKILGTH